MRNNTKKSLKSPNKIYIWKQIAATKANHTFLFIEDCWINYEKAIKQTLKCKFTLIATEWVSWLISLIQFVYLVTVAHNIIISFWDCGPWF